MLPAGAVHTLFAQVTYDLDLSAQGWTKPTDKETCMYKEEITHLCRRPQEKWHYGWTGKASYFKKFWTI